MERGRRPQDKQIPATGQTRTLRWYYALAATLSRRGTLAQGGWEEHPNSQSGATTGAGADRRQRETSKTEKDGSRVYETREVLKQARTLHERLRCLYADASRRAVRQEVEVFLALMSDREHEIEEILTQYERVAAGAVVRTWNKIPSDGHLHRLMDRFRVEREATCADALNAILPLQRCVSGLHAQTAQSVQSELLREALVTAVQAQKEEDIHAMSCSA